MVQYQDITRGKFGKVDQCKNVKNIYTGHQTILFEMENEDYIFIAKIVNSIPDFSNPIETGFFDQEEILLFEPFLINNTYLDDYNPNDQSE